MRLGNCGVLSGRNSDDDRVSATHYMKAEWADIGTAIALFQSYCVRTGQVWNASSFAILVFLDLDP